MKKGQFHPRNRHQGHYPFQELVQCSPALIPYVKKSELSLDETVDFSDPAAVQALNRALLVYYYGIKDWKIPSGYLCPPIPGRADYVHSVADLLAASNADTIPCGAGVRVLDIGVGANCIYPILGQCEYGWSFVGSDVDAQALTNAQAILDANADLKRHIQLRLQTAQNSIFKGVIQPQDFFDVTVCNPPFHASLEEANRGTQRKLKNIRNSSQKNNPTARGFSSRHLPADKPLAGNLRARNFGGQGAELWCPGGEVAFIQQMILESALYAKNCFWFSTLVSKESNLPMIYKTLEEVKIQHHCILNLSQGQKKSRVVAWTFLGVQEQAQWVHSLRLRLKNR